MPGRPLFVLLPGFDGSGQLFEPLRAQERLPFEPHVVALPADAPRGYDELLAWLEPRLPTEPYGLPAEVAAARARAALAADEATTFARITCPTLWTTATADRLLRPEHIDELRAARPDANVALIDGPHTILQRRPVDCLAAIAELLAGAG